MTLYLKFRTHLEDVKTFQIETCESEISVRIESRIESAATIRIRIESADSRLQFQC